MQPIRRLSKNLAVLANHDHFLFTLSDLSGLLPDLTDSAFKALIGRAVKNDILRRVCRNIYLYPVNGYPSGLLLYRTAARLRAHEFNYISLESVLSDAGVISQVPLSWITLMSTGRSHIINCGDWGHIEFIHTKKKLESLAAHIHYDKKCGLWRSSVAMALQDMKFTGRNMDLIDWGIAHEFI